MLSRRRMMQGTAALALAGLPRAAFAQDQPAAPIVFVHGDSDAAAIWQTTFWRFESNGYPRDRLFAINFTDPQARDDDTIAQANRSSTQDQLRELTAFINGVKAQTGAAKVAIVALSRGGYAARGAIAANPASVSHAVLGGTPNHGVFAIDALLGSEYNGRGPFLMKLNAGDSEVTPGVPFLTLRSDGYDLYAQPDGRFIGHPGAPINVTAEGPALKGATNLVLGQVDHRGTACSPRAFAEIYKFIVGRAPARIAIAPEAEVVVNGLVTGVVEGTPTNRPVEGALVEVYRISAETGERQGTPAHAKKTGADGVWGPAKFDSISPLEFVVTAPGAPITHIYRSVFPRSFAQLNLRPSAAVAKEDSDATAIVRMDRPRGYFGLPRDIVLLDGKEPTDIPPGVPATWHTQLKLAAVEDRPIVGEFNEERIVARAWPAKDGHVTIIELTA
ncbi:hydrolase [Methylocapsa sp. S129]|uniref:hydrolase n=1 Tax=Methylocapsa sp. S129 TaxID=1641869 RepID=UPI00131C7F09|nr:hydrolase [Methylocapsa sp. S129]